MYLQMYTKQNAIFLTLFILLPASRLTIDIHECLFTSSCITEPYSYSLSFKLEHQRPSQLNLITMNRIQKRIIEEKLETYIYNGFSETH